MDIWTQTKTAVALPSLRSILLAQKRGIAAEQVWRTSGMFP